MQAQNLAAQRFIDTEKAPGLLLHSSFETHILCFDESYTAIFVSQSAGELCEYLFNCLPLATQPLPFALKKMAAEIKDAQAPPVRKSGRYLQFNLGNRGTLSLRLAQDCGSSYQCLIFEMGKVLTDHTQLLPLGLSTRQAEIAYWTCEKKTNWEIGKILGISPRTVEKHLENIFVKLQVHDRNELVTKVWNDCDF